MLFPLTIKLKTLSHLFLIAVVFLSSCNTETKMAISAENKTQPSLNPNGDSELALLMRDMYDEAERIKTQIKNEEEVTIDLDHESILTAHATEPEKAASPEYKAFAKAYLQSLESLQAANQLQLESQFNHLIANCMACHQSLCPGPMVKIKKLR